MSAGGVFKLIANDGKPDRLLVATALVNQRIVDVMCARRRAGKDPTPTLLDVEKTHIIHVNAHFKPFAALGYEYNKVRPQSGSTTLGGNVQFSIPQFGDFFHDMVMHAVLSETYTGSLTVPSAGNTATGPYGLRSTFPSAGNGWNDSTSETGATYALVDAFGNTVAQTYRNMVRYVEYPGERLAASVKFDVNGNPLDEYNYRIPGMLRKFQLSDEKLHGYKKLVGQETCFEGFSGPRVCRVEDTHYDTTAPSAGVDHGSAAGPNAGSSLNQGITPAAYVLDPRHKGAELFPSSWDHDTDTTVTESGQTASVPVQVESPINGGAGPSGAQWGHVQRSCLKAVDGPQTPKYWQPPVEMWIRLWFWFNLDARLSIPSVSIPYGQRFITVDLARGEDIVVDFPGLFVEQTITDPTGMTTGSLTAGSVTRNFRPYWQRSTITMPTITTFELYINNIFVNPEIHDLYIRRVGFSLIRVFRQHSTTTNASGEHSELLSQLKWPIEYMFIGLQPQINTNSTTNVNYHRDWHRMGKTFDAVCDLRQSALHATTDSAGAGSVTSTSNIGQIVPDHYVIERPVISSLSLTAHGIKIHDNIPQAFFSTYKPFHYGDASIRPPTDPGAMMINFALFNCYQPSGYLNVSRARELYLHWNSTYISSTTSVILIAIGIALNFLLVTDGSAVLRYST